MNVSEIYQKFREDPLWDQGAPAGRKDPNPPFFFSYKDAGGAVVIGCRKNLRRLNTDEGRSEIIATLNCEVVDEFLTREQLESLRSCQTKTQP